MYKNSLGKAFQDVVYNNLNEPALILSPSYSITYGKLNEKSNQLARHLIKLGVTQKDVVCIS